MSELSWLFWMLVIFLFAESWARAWAAYQHGSEPPSQGMSPPDASS